MPLQEIVKSGLLLQGTLDALKAASRSTPRSCRSASSPSPLADTALAYFGADEEALETIRSGHSERNLPYLTGSLPSGGEGVLSERPWACYVAARPKNAGNHLNSQFKLYEYAENAKKWNLAGWKSIGEVSKLMQTGNEVRTGKIADNNMSSGAAVELELRIAKNDTNYKISDMPDV